MKGFLNNLPGYRSNKLWIKIISTIIYILILLFILALFLSSSNDKFNSYDHSIERLLMAWCILFLIIVPYILISNIFGIRKKLPLFKNNTILGTIFGSIISLLIIILFLGVGEPIINNYHSPEYKVAQEIKKQEEKTAQISKQAEKNSHVQTAKSNSEVQNAAEAPAAKAKIDGQNNNPAPSQATPSIKIQSVTSDINNQNSQEQAPQSVTNADMSSRNTPAQETQTLLIKIVLRRIT